MAFVGAGVSRELGIPTWDELAKALLSRLPPKKDKTEVEQLLRAKRYAEVCGWIARNVSEKFLYSNCRELLADTGATGKASECIVKCPFKSVFTTNLDDSLKRHFEAAGKAVSTYLNTPEDLAAVDVDSLTCIVKLHSDLDHTDTLILTDSQYAKVGAAGDFDYLRLFIKSYFATKRFIIIGCSLSDPDIKFLLGQVGQNLRRKSPILAIMADATPDECARWKIDANIEIISYKNRSGAHKELASLLEALSGFVTEPTERRHDPQLDLRRAQSLYLWSKFSLSGDNASADVDSLKSILLFQLNEREQELSSLEESTSEFVGLAAPLLSAAITKAVKELEKSGHIRRVGEVIGLSQEAASLVGLASRQHANLREAFSQQTTLDLAERWADVPAADRESAVGLMLTAIVEVFNERGVELVNCMFGKAGFGSRRSAGLFATLSRVGGELGDDDLKHRFVSYSVDVLTNPRPAQRAYLEHLALAFLSLNALAMDPEGLRFRREYLSGRPYLVDSNILIPLLPLSATFRGEFEDLLSLARANNIPLMTTEGFVEELYRHGMWASDLVGRYGESSIEVLQAARGDGYKSNTFLDGFVQYCVDERNVTFGTYLRKCVGDASFTKPDIMAYLNRRFGIGCVKFQDVASERPDAFPDRETVEEYIRQEAEAHQIDKGESRIKAEAEAYVVVANWDALIPPTGVGKDDYGPSSIAVLSQGGYLNRIARSGPKPLNRYIVVPPDALYGLLLRSGAVPRSPSSFRDLMMSPLFAMSYHFLPMEKYRAFFSHLINDAERIYGEHLEAFQAQIDSALKPEFFEDVQPLDRPYVTASLQHRLEAAEREGKERELAERLAAEKSKSEKKDKRIRTLEAIVGRRARKKAGQKKKKR